MADRTDGIQFVLPEGNKDIVKLINAFGLDDKLLQTFELRVVVGEIVSIKTEMYATEEDIKKGAKEWDVVSKKYLLVEK